MLVEKIVAVIIVLGIVWFIGILCGYTLGYDNGRINTIRKIKGEEEVDAWKPKKYR